MTRTVKMGLRNKSQKILVLSTAILECQVYFQVKVTDRRRTLTLCLNHQDERMMIGCGNKSYKRSIQLQIIALFRTIHKCMRSFK